MRVLTSEAVLKMGEIFVFIKPPNHFLGKTTHFDLFFKAVDQFIKWGCISTASKSVMLDASTDIPMLSYRIRLNNC